MANQEQLSISMRYVHKNVLYERFLGFLTCETGVTGEALAENILTQLTSWQLSPDLLRGQSYDGAGAMSGKVKGVAARINSQYPKALFVHCVSHRLNLSCSGCEVSNMIDTVSCIARFFNYSPKRQVCLDRWITDTLPTEEKGRKLKELCKTRWVERYDSYEVFIDLFVPIACCLEDIANSSNAAWNRETRSEALSFLLALSQFSLIFTLMMVHTILASTRGLSIKLQARYMDIVRAHSDIHLVKSTLKEYRSRVDDFHHRVYDKALALAVSIDLQESSPRLAGRQTQRRNVQAANAKDYYKLNLTVPFLDHMITELETRFDSQSSTVVIEFTQLLPAMINPDSPLTPQKFPKVMELYEDDLPSPTSFDIELDMWASRWTSESKKSVVQSLSSPTEVLSHTDPDYFPNIYKLMIIMTTIPVTSCECERSISLLRLVKNCVRARMSEERLNGLALMQYYHDIPIDRDRIVEDFARTHPRRMDL